MNKHEILQVVATEMGLHFDPTRKDPKGLWVVRSLTSCQSDQVLWNPFVHYGDLFLLLKHFHMQIDSDDRSVYCYRNGVHHLQHWGKCETPNTTAMKMIYDIIQIRPLNA